MSYKEEFDCPALHMCSVRCEDCYSEHLGCHVFCNGLCSTYKEIFEKYFYKVDNSPIYFIKKTEAE